MIAAASDPAFAVRASSERSTEIVPSSSSTPSTSVSGFQVVE
jgi:hypothetical protein